MPTDDKLKALYGTLVKDGYEMPDYNTFKTDMQDEKKLNGLHTNLVKDGYEMPDFNTFKADVGGSTLKKKEQSTTTPSVASDISSKSNSAPTVPSVKSEGEVLTGGITPKISLSKPDLSSQGKTIKGVSITPKTSNIPKPPKERVMIASQGTWKEVGELDETAKGAITGGITTTDLAKKSTYGKHVQAYNLLKQDKVGEASKVIDELLEADPNDGYANQLVSTIHTQSVLSRPFEELTANEVKTWVNLTDKTKQTNPDDPNAYLMASFAKIKSLPVASKEETPIILEGAKKDASVVAKMNVKIKGNNYIGKVQSDENNSFNLGQVSQLGLKAQAMDYLQAIAAKEGNLEDVKKYQKERKLIDAEKKNIFAEADATDMQKMLKSDEGKYEILKQATGLSLVEQAYNTAERLGDANEAYNNAYYEAFKETKDAAYAHKVAERDKVFFIAGNILKTGLAVAPLIPGTGMLKVIMQMDIAEKILPEKAFFALTQPLKAMFELAGYKKTDFSAGELEMIEGGDFLAGVFFFGAGERWAKRKIEGIRAKNEVNYASILTPEKAFVLSEKIRKNEPMTKDELQKVADVLDDMTNKDAANAMLKKAATLDKQIKETEKIKEETAPKEVVEETQPEVVSEQPVIDQTEQVQTEPIQTEAVQPEVVETPKVDVTDAQIVESLENTPPEMGTSWKDFTEKIEQGELGVIENNIRKKISEGVELNEATRQALDEYLNPENITNETTPTSVGTEEVVSEQQTNEAPTEVSPDQTQAPETTVLPEITQEFEGRTYVKKADKQGRTGVVERWYDKETGEPVNNLSQHALDDLNKPKQDFSKKRFEKKGILGGLFTKTSKVADRLVSAIDEKIGNAIGDEAQTKKLEDLKNKATERGKYNVLSIDEQFEAANLIIDSFKKEGVDETTALYEAYDVLRKDNSVAGGVREITMSKISEYFEKEYERTGNESLHEKSIDIIMDLVEDGRDIARALASYKHIYATNTNFIANLYARKAVKIISELTLSDTKTKRISKKVDRFLTGIPKETAKLVAERIIKEYPGLVEIKTKGNIESKRAKVEQRSKEVKSIIDQMKADKTMFSTLGVNPIPVKLIEYSGKLLVALSKEGYAKADLAIAELRRIIKEHFDRDLTDDEIKAITDSQIEGKSISEHLKENETKSKELESLKKELQEHKQKRSVSKSDQNKLDATAERIEKRIAELEKKSDDIEGLIGREKTSKPNNEPTEIKDLKKDIRDKERDLNNFILEAHNDTTPAKRENLINKIKDRFGVENEAAESIADKALKYHKENIGSFRERELRKLYPFKKKIMALGNRQDRINQKIIKTIENIDTSSPDAHQKFMDAAAEKYGIPNMKDPAVMRKLQQLTENIQKYSNNVHYRDVAITEMYKYISDITRESLINAGISTFYANILSGPITQYKNVSWNAVRLMIELPILEASKGGRGTTLEYIRGLKEGGMAAEEIIKKGGVRRGQGIGMTPSSERTQRYKIMNYKKYPGRGLTAGDTMLNLPYRQTKVRQLAMFYAEHQLKQDGIKITKEVRKKVQGDVNNILLDTQGRLRDAVELANKATREYYKIDQDVLSIENGKVVRNKAVKNREVYRSALLDVFGNIEKSRAEALDSKIKSPIGILKEATNWADQKTLTAKPTGTFGFIAGLVNKALDAFPVARVTVMPFVNIPLNLAKFQWENAPILGAFSSEIAILMKKESIIGTQLLKQMGTYKELTPAMIHEYRMRSLYTGTVTAILGGLTSLMYTDDDGKERPIMIVYGRGSGTYSKDRSRETTSGGEIHENTIDFMGIHIPYGLSPFAVYLSVFGTARDNAMENGSNVPQYDASLAYTAMSNLLQLSFDQANFASISKFTENVSNFSKNSEKGVWDMQSYAKSGALLLKGFVMPNVILQGNTIADVILGNPAKQAITWDETLYKGVPFLNDMLSDRLDYQGRPVKTEIDCPLVSIFFKGITPDDANDIDRLFAKNNYLPPSYNNDTIWDEETGMEINITNEQRYEILKARSKYMINALEAAKKGDSEYSLTFGTEIEKVKLGKIPEGSNTDFAKFMSEIYTFANKCALLDVVKTHKIKQTQSEIIKQEHEESGTPYKSKEVKVSFGGKKKYKGFPKNN